MERGAVVVGVDGSPASAAAVAWALEAARAAGAALEVVGAPERELAHHGPLPWGSRQGRQDAAAQRVHEAVEDARSAAPGVPVHGTAAEGDAAAALLAAADGAQLLVLGRHGEGALRRLVTVPSLGSVTGHCLHRSPVPVAVVPPDAPPVPRRVVAAVDGSDLGLLALEQAAACADQRGAPLAVVLAWQLVPRRLAPAAPATVPAQASWGAVAKEELEQAVRAVLPPERARDVQRLLLHRPAADGRLGGLDAHDLLVVGDRGRGALARRLLGSAGRQCAEHAPGAVVVVPPWAGQVPDEAED